MHSCPLMSKRCRHRLCPNWLRFANPNIIGLVNLKNFSNLKDQINWPSKLLKQFKIINILNQKRKGALFDPSLNRIYLQITYLPLYPGNLLFKNRFYKKNEFEPNNYRPTLIKRGWPTWFDATYAFYKSLKI